MSSRRALAALACLLLPACAARPSLVDSDPQTGFALYRVGQLDRAELRALCAAGVEEMLVLDGGAAQRECSFRPVDCPGLRIRYDFRQDARTPLDRGFLGAFDAWIEEAGREGRKVAIRCRHGWHRAGRLTAYYRMRFQGVSAGQAVTEMNRLGRFMWRHRQLEPQVRALGDLVAGRPCSVERRHCPLSESRPAEGLAPDGTLPADSCP